MFETLDSIPWHEVRHAYGCATDAPKWIRALDSEDQNLRSDALMHFLFSSATHQYTLYPATPFVIPFVIEALQSAALSQRDDGLGQHMAFYMIQFLRSCATSGQRAMYSNPHPKAPTVERAVASGAAIYERYLRDPDPRIRGDAEWLLRFCNEQAHVA
jgi:hypothetical protein